MRGKKILSAVGSILLFVSAFAGIVLMMCESDDMTTQYITSGIGMLLFLVGAIPAIVYTKRGDEE